MKNGNKVTKKNWQNVIAISDKLCTNVGGVPAIDAAKASGGYYEKWKLVFENHGPERTGYIFREINHDGGINGHHDNFKQAIWNAIRNNIHVYLEEPASSIQQPCLTDAVGQAVTSTQP